MTSDSGLRLPTRKFHYGWLVLTVYLVMGTILNGPRLSFGVFLIPLTVDLNLTRAQVSAICSVYWILSIFLGILGGWALDRFGPKLVVVLMGFFTGLSLLLTSQASATWQLFVSYSLLLAVGTGATYTVIMSSVSKWFPVNRGLALGIVSCGAGLGLLIMAPIAEHFVSHYGWHTSFLIMALPAFLVIMPSALLLKRAPNELVALGNSRKPDSLDNQASRGKHFNSLEEVSLLQAAKALNFWLLLPIQFLTSSCVYVVMVHIVPHATDLGIASAQAATILSSVGGASIVGRLLLGMLSDRIGSKQACLIWGLTMAGSMLLLIKASNVWTLYLFAVMFGFSWGGFGPTTAGLVADAFGLRHVGAIQGAVGAGWGTGSAFGPFIGGYIFDVSGSYVSTFWACVMAMLIATVLILLVKTQKVMLNKPTNRMLSLA